MLLSMNWISDFVDLSGLDKVALIKNFTLSTAEVEDIIVKGEDTYGVIAAKIVSVENHPNSKKLHLLKVDTGSGVIDVVCGAPNVREGMHVALATEGGSVSGNKIGAATIAGYASHGMCCSEAELGISDDNSGIIDLDETIPLGTDLKTVYDIDDIIFEVDNKSLTNRPDLWGHYGIAREFSTITGRALKAPRVLDTEAFSTLPEVALSVKATDLVWRYTAIKVENITRKVSPVNMRIRLYYCGSRAINLLADLTNYVMLELGQPMHAFDLARVDKIEVQTFDKPFTFTTLDGIERKMDDTMLMITSGDEPVAIAGVMGGDSSKIEDTTTSLLLESATFDGVSVRKTTTKLGLRTDASMRYEKMLDPELCRFATERLLSLLLECDGGVRVISAFTDCYVKRYPKIELEFDKAYVDRYTGIDIPTETITTTLNGLGFGVDVKGESFKVTVPSFRATKDVTIKADVIEEISRIYGYDNFDVRTSVSPIYPVREQTQKSYEDRMKDVLVASYRMHEVHSYIWSDTAKDKELNIKTPEGVRIINAQTPDHQYIRVSMIPTLLSFAKSNRAYAQEFGIFEIGHTVDGLLENGLCNERKKLGAVLFSRVSCEEALFKKALSTVEELFSDVLHKSPEYRASLGRFGFEHPMNTYEILLDGKAVGFIAPAHPEVCSAVDKKCAVVFFEIDTGLVSLIEKERTVYQAPSKFPEIDIDLTFRVTLAEVNFPALTKLAGECAGELLRSVAVQDIYETDDGCSLTLRFTFASDERTLSKGELEPITREITERFDTLGVKFNA
ncbi:MAG: phenylalanine--tRNA ligase subunit beta [Clostridia bacterium]|nr:phenylalanine--tRNA ligase subunit beta [Clostridia bacterium]